jgi:hypothetical protein
MPLMLSPKFTLSLIISTMAEPTLGALLVALTSQPAMTMTRLWMNMVSLFSTEDSL